MLKNLKKDKLFSTDLSVMGSVGEMNHPFGAAQQFMIFNTPTFTLCFQTASFLFILDQSKKDCFFVNTNLYFFFLKTIFFFKLRGTCTAGHIVNFSSFIFAGLAIICGSCCCRGICVNAGNV